MKQLLITLLLTTIANSATVQSSQVFDESIDSKRAAIINRRKKTTIKVVTPKITFNIKH